VVVQSEDKIPFCHPTGSSEYYIRMDVQITHHDRQKLFAGISIENVEKKRTFITATEAPKRDILTVSALATSIPALEHEPDLIWR
jgi:hypothetical protein